MHPTVLLSHRILGDGSDALFEELTTRLEDVDIQRADGDSAFRELLLDAEVLVTQRFEDWFLDDAPNLQWVQALSAGYDMYPLDELEARDIVLTTASGVHAEPIAEQILGYLLSFERNIHRGIHQQRDGEWNRYFGGELRGRTVGIVGLGAIGSRAAELCRSLGMTVLGTKRDPATAPEAVDEVYGPNGLDELLDRSAYLVVACPLTDETRGLIDAAALDLLDDRAVVVNVGRGEIIDEEALVDALESGELRGAALDVFEEEPLPSSSPLWDRRDVIVTPHMAGSTPFYWMRCADIVEDNLERYRSGAGEFRNRIV